MNWKDNKELLEDYFTPSELISFLDITTEELIWYLEQGDYFDEQTVEELNEIMGVRE